MKKKLSSFAFTLCMGIFYSAYASDSPCVTAYALNFALAQQEYNADLIYCNGQTVFAGPCQEEAHRKFENAVHNVETAYSECCCVNSLTQCCN